MSIDLHEYRFQTKLRAALNRRLEGSYKSKAYRAYINRYIEHYAPTQSTIQGLSDTLAAHLLDTANRPGFTRRMIGGAATSEYDRKQAELKQRVDAIMSTVLPYSRKIHYPSKGLK